MASLRSNGSNSRFQMSGSFSSSLKRDGEVIRDCRCGFKAMIRTVTKKGPNRGRRFWGCRYWNANDDESGCGFFKWVGETESQSHTVDTMELKCVECDKKDVQILKMQAEEKSTKFLLKIVVVICLLLAIVCIIVTISLIINSLK
ncbi:DNA topoisomerase [Trifolium repens]|nr:DNA topoisomerase [Trifolium repens]